MAHYLNFILSFLMANDISLFTAFICSDKNVIAEFTNSAFLFGFRFKICNNLNSCTNTFFKNNAQGIILDVKCKGVRQILTQASDNRAFDALHYWLILDDDENTLNNSKIEELMAGVTALPNSNFLWKTRTLLLDMYRTKAGEKLQISSISNYDNSPSKTEDLRIKWNSLFNPTRQRKNLQNIFLKASTVISQPQFFTGWDDLSMKHIDTWPKVTFPIMKNLAKDLNYRVGIKQTDNYGVLQPNGTFNGLCGQIQRREIEFGITSMFMRKDRWDALDFCAETIFLRSSFMFRQPPQSTISNIFILPFNTDVWIASLCMFSLVGLFLSIISKKMVHIDRTLKRMNASEVLSFTVGTVCQQGTSLNPHLTSTRVIMLFSFITSMFIFTSYSAKIVAILQSPSTAIKTLSNLAHSPIALGVQETTYKKVYFMESNDRATQYLYKHKIAPQGDSAYMSVVDGINRAKKNLFAFQVETGSGYDIISKTYTEREKCGLAEIEAFKLPMVAVPIQKHSGYRELFASRIRWQREIGLIDRTKKIWIAQKPICNEGLTGFVSVGFVECLPAINVLFYGTVLALLVCLNEIILFRFGRELKSE